MISQRIKMFELKIDEYYLSFRPSIQSMPDKSFLREWPLIKFNIQNLYNNLTMQIQDNCKNRVAEKLIDIKLHYAYLLTTVEQFYRGPALIVGNNEIEKLNPNTISVLREIHYKVYLLAVICEEIFDLLELIFWEKISDPTKNKWGKLIEKVQKQTMEEIITNADRDLLLNFKNKYRRAEFHQYSAVRAFISKEKWDQFQSECDAIDRLLKNVYNYFERCNIK